jgi:hypothetical protein
MDRGESIPRRREICKMFGTVSRGRKIPASSNPSISKAHVDPEEGYRLEATGLR